MDPGLKRKRLKYTQAECIMLVQPKKLGSSGRAKSWTAIADLCFATDHDDPGLPIPFRGRIFNYRMRMPVLYVVLLLLVAVLSSNVQIETSTSRRSN